MKKIMLLFLLSLGAQLGYGQIVGRNLPAPQSQLLMLEKIKIPFTQPPLLHTDGGWEKGPSAWTASGRYPVEYRAGLVFANHGKSGAVQYLMPEIRFKESGTIQIAANSMDQSTSAKNGWISVFGKKGEVIRKPVICTEAEFGTQLILFLKEFKPYKPMVVN